MSAEEHLKELSPSWLWLQYPKSGNDTKYKTRNRGGSRLIGRPTLLSLAKQTTWPTEGAAQSKKNTSQFTLHEHVPHF